MSKLAELLALAGRAARAGAEAIERHVPSAGDLEPDRSAESAIRDVLALERPDDGMLGEEGTDAATRTGLRWVVDPRDGAVNHEYGAPHWAVSIACDEAVGPRWQTVVGVVVDVARDEVFSAVRGGEARLNGARLQVRRCAALERAVVATEFSYSAAGRARQAATLAKVLPSVRDVRSTGSSALDLCWVAAGRCDGYFEDELFRWDWAAGALIVQAAGGTVSALGSGVVAAGPELHGALAAIVQP